MAKFSSQFPVRFEVKKVLTFLGDSWPQTDFAAWERIHDFRLVAPGVLQGFDYFGEPRGPSLEFKRLAS